MSAYQARRLAEMAQRQAVAAVNIVQRRGIKNDEDRYQEFTALALANLSQAFVEFMKDQ